MDIQNILITSSITTSLYAFIKGGLHLYKNYYLKSECHDNQLIIEVVTQTHEEEKQIQPLHPLPSEEEKQIHLPEEEKQIHLPEIKPTEPTR
jgi:hypothetical protein